MHAMITWRIRSQSGDGWRAWNDRLMAVLQPYKWLRPLDTTYVVELDDVDAYETIAKAFDRIANEAETGTVAVIMSPPINGGRYGGVLPEDMWPALNALSDPQAN